MKPPVPQGWVYYANSQFNDWRWYHIESGRMYSRPSTTSGQSMLTPRELISLGWDAYHAIDARIVLPEGV